MSNVVILQARMSSRRFPGKVLEDLGGIPMLGYQLSRLRESKRINRIVVATSDEPSDDEIVDFLSSISQECIRGPLNDVFSRFMKVLELVNPEYFLRITGDCPLVMPDLIDQMIEVFESSQLDYLSNTLEPNFPDGLDIEIVRTVALRKLGTENLEATEREHVTMGIYKRSKEFKTQNFYGKIDFSGERWTVDYPEDLDFIRNIVQYEKSQGGFLNYEEVLHFLSMHPNIHNRMPNLIRNESLLKSLDNYEKP